MPKRPEHVVAIPTTEIIAPPRFSCRGAVVCDCCRQSRSKDEFDEDALGSCAECLGSDAVLIDLVARFQES